MRNADMNLRAAAAIAHEPHLLRLRDMDARPATAAGRETATLRLRDGSLGAATAARRKTAGLLLRDTNPCSATAAGQEKARLRLRDRTLRAATAHETATPRLRDMSHRSATAMLAAALFAFAAASASAHHPIHGKFDADAALTLSGIVTHVDWRNPHTHIFMNVGEGDETLNWAVELESPIDLEANGWTQRTVLPGDAITVAGIVARDGTRQIWGDSVVRSDSGSRVFAVSLEAPPPPLAPRSTPRWPDGQPALGGTADAIDGYWSYPSATALVEAGVDVAMDASGLLDNLDEAERVAPLQPWALALYRHRQERSLRDDPMYLNCKPPGGPRQYLSHHGFQLIEDRERERIFVLLGSGNRNYRIIYLDGREHVGQVGGDDDNPLYYGRSVGNWDGDTLIVDTRGFNEDFWFTNGGLPHTSRLRLIERFTRTDLETLEYEVTIEDPGAYTRSWTSRWTLRWVGGEDLPFHLCQHNRP